jgi:phenylacetate-CoA ligase
VFFRTLIDIARSSYVSLPPSLRKIVAPLVASLPGELKYGPTYDDFTGQIVRSQHDAEFVANYQAKRVRELVDLAYRKSDFYKGIFNSAGIFEPEINEFQPNQLSRVSIQTKDDLLGNIDRMLTKPKQLLDEVSTSGSSGRPTVFCLDKDRSVKEWAYIHTYWAGADFNLNDPRAVLRGIHIQNVDDQPWEYEAALKELRLSPFHLTEHNMHQFLLEIEKRQIKYLNGYPSALHILAKYAAAVEWGYSDEIQGIFPISESLHPHQRLEITKAFPSSKILPFYGLSEKTAFAVEVKGEPGLYEFEPTYGITELVDDHGNSIVAVGDKGRIISTGLLHFGMPLIRYDTGDVAVLRQLPAHQNQYRLRVSDIQSRWAQEFVVGRGGELISIAALNVHSPSYGSIKEFQFYQDEEGRVDVQVVVQVGAKEADVYGFVNEIQEKVGGTITFELKIMSEIERNSRGKTRMIVQRLNIDKGI